jgi:uncharacterized small protein (DUF1192 family)
VAASPEAKHRLRVILRTIAGEMTVAEACAELGIGESRFHALRKDVLTRAAEALEPRPAGRPPVERDEEVEALKARNLELEMEQRAALLREEIARVMPEILHPPEGRALPGAARRRKKKSAPGQAVTRPGPSASGCWRFSAGARAKGRV